MEEYLSIKGCNCGRSYCDFFGAGIGERGQSFSRKDVEEMLRDSRKLVKHLEKILKKKTKSV